MILVVLLAAVVLVVAAVRNSQGALFTAVGQDVPAFVVWGAAILALGAIGFVPGLKPVSRGLLALVIVVLVLQNYQNVLKGFQSAWTNPPASTGPNTSVANAGSGSGSGSAASGSPSGINLNTASSAFNSFSQFEGAFGSGGGASAFSSGGLDAGTAATAASAAVA